MIVERIEIDLLTPDKLDEVSQILEIISRYAKVRSEMSRADSPWLKPFYDSKLAKIKSELERFDNA